MTPRKLYIRAINNKVDSIETAHSYCSFVTLKRSIKVHVDHAFLINDDKTLPSLLNLSVQFYLCALLKEV